MLTSSLMLPERSIGSDGWLGGWTCGLPRGAAAAAIACRVGGRVGGWVHTVRGGAAATINSRGSSSMRFLHA